MLNEHAQFATADLPKTRDVRDSNF